MTYCSLPAKMVALEESGSIDGYITYLESGAHSPHHTVFWIREEDHVVFLAAMSPLNFNK